jgi:hypothetical protein
MTPEEKKKLADDNAHIPTEEVEHDILETEKEIRDAEEKATHLEKTPLSMREARWDHMRASSLRSQIVQRKKFVEKLKIIIEVRKQNEQHQ